jgi:hypothetical protein
MHACTRASYFVRMRARLTGGIDWIVDWIGSGVGGMLVVVDVLGYNEWFDFDTIVSVSITLDMTDCCRDAMLGLNP